MEGERTGLLGDTDPSSVPYFAVAVVPSRIGNPGQVAPGPGEVVVVGTGPAGPLWLTPQTRRALADAEVLVGYTTYLDRVPVKPGQVRHGSDNKVESERAEFALDLARRGKRVAVVSGGDPGVFAMATAVLEVAGQAEYKDVPVRVLPGVTAANAAAAAAGAPSATTTPRSPSPTGSSRGRSSRSGCARPPPPTWSSRCTTPARAAAPGRWRRPGSCCWSCVRPRPRWSSPVTWAARSSRCGSSRSPSWSRPRWTCARSC